MGGRLALLPAQRSRARSNGARAVLRFQQPPTGRTVFSRNMSPFRIREVIMEIIRASVPVTVLAACQNELCRPAQSWSRDWVDMDSGVDIDSGAPAQDDGGATADCRYACAAE